MKSFKYFNILLFSFTIFLFFLFFSPTLVLAEPEWKMPAPRITISESLTKALTTPPAECGTENGKTKICISWISDYIAGIYKYAIGAVAILATIVMMIGGVVWITAGGSQTRVSTAKDYISGAIIGLVLTLSSYTILYFVNPDLVKLKPIIVTKVEPINNTAEEVDMEKLKDGAFTRNLLNQRTNGKITVNKAECTSLAQTDCTSLSNLPQNAISGLITMANEIGTSFVITGGTEAGHKEHGQNKPVVDLRLCPSNCRNVDMNTKLLSYIHDKIGLGWGEKIEYQRYTANDNSFTVLREKNTDESEHFHIVFN